MTTATMTMDPPCPDLKGAYQQLTRQKQQLTIQMVETQLHLALQFRALNTTQKKEYRAIVAELDQTKDHLKTLTQLSRAQSEMINQLNQQADFERSPESGGLGNFWHLWHCGTWPSACGRLWPESSPSRSGAG